MAKDDDATVYKAFVDHINKLATLAAAGDEDAVRSLACIVLLQEGWRDGPDPDGGGEVVDLSQYRMAA